MPYHYIDSGLDHVWLVNGYARHETPYGEGVSIQDVDGLHRAIGRAIIDAPRPISGAEARFLRMEMDLTQKRLGGLLGVDEQAVRRWEKFRVKPLQGAVDRLLRAVYAEYVGGDGAVRKMVERLADLDVIPPGDCIFARPEEAGAPILRLRVAGRRRLHNRRDLL